MNKDKIGNASSFKYIKSLDAVRGFAVFMVLIHHANAKLFKGGWIGVDLFFVLSGFLITSLLSKEHFETRSISIKKFYGRRILRLFPALFIGIVLANVLWNVSVSAFFPGYDRKMATLGSFFYFTNIIPGSTSANMAHLWSLAVEEHFYLFWPAICLFFLPLSYNIKRNSLMLLLTLTFCFRIYCHFHEVTILGTTLVIDPGRFTFCKIDEILVGIILSLLISYNKIKWNMPAKKTTTCLSIIIAIFLGIFIFFEGNEFWASGGFVVAYIISFFLILIAIKNEDHPFFSGNFLKWLGTRSYGLYVYHFPIFLALEPFRKNHGLSTVSNLTNLVTVFVLRLLLTVIVAELFFRYIEQPILKYKKKFV